MKCRLVFLLPIKHKTALENIRRWLTVVLALTHFPAHTPPVLQEFHKLGCVVPRLPSLPAPGSSSIAVPDLGTTEMRPVANGWFSEWVGASPKELNRPGGPRAAVRGKSQWENRDF